MTHLQLTTPSCTVCGDLELYESISFGNQPPSNRFLAEPADVEKSQRYPLSLGFCPACGTVQLVDRMPFEAFRPRYDWLVYNEPEGHLDDVSDRLLALDGLGPDSRLLGITYKDQTTLHRMAKRGLTRIQCLDEKLLECKVAPFGLESIQARLTEPSVIDKLKDTYGTVDLLLVRHIAEHANSATGLVKSLSSLIRPGGYMMLELPDAQRIFDAANVPFVWEEHISYFTASSAARLVQEAGAELVRLDRYPYPYEDSLIVVMRFERNQGASHQKPISHGVSAAGEQLMKLEKQFAPRRQRWRDELESIRAAGGKIAVFGAGHLAVKFVNFWNLGDLIECVIDDHPKKAGMYMPGSGLPIFPSPKLEELGIRHCVSTLSPESEVKVRAKLPSYFAAGGVFISAFSAVR